jgi:hypothetical protein
MKLTTAMLADGVRSGVDGKLYIFGGQWDHVFASVLPTTQKVAFALVIQVDYSEALREHRLDIVLKDADGKDLGPKVAASFRPGHPPLTEVGAPVSVALPVEPPAFPINQYGRLIWEVLLDGKRAGELPMVVLPPPNAALPFNEQEEVKSEDAED